jgi:penicillin-binding protein 1B
MRENQEIPNSPRAGLPHFFRRNAVRILLLSLAAGVTAGGFLAGYYYLKFAARIDRMLAAGAFSDTVDIFSAPRTLAVADPVSLEETVARLRRGGYTTARGNPLGWYHLRPAGIEVFPGRDSLPGGEPALIQFSGGKVARIVSLEDNTERRQYELGPQLIANLSEHREHRRLVRFGDIPPTLVHAVISAEDKHFFQHSGFDLFRVAKAAWVDLKDGRKEQGASTLSMQLTRGFWLDPDKSWKRKTQELLMTMHLEHKLSKRQIFEDYANQVYLGHRSTFSINGFGEGARALLGKDIGQLDSAEAALLAGIVQRPGYYNPWRYPERARERRNVVLALMRQNGYLSDAACRQAVQEPVTIAPEQSEGTEIQYFLDLVGDELQARLDDHEKQTRYVYTTLDPDLQHAAESAVAAGMDFVDRQLHKKKLRRPVPAGQPQVALIAIDPHTGEIKALVGGRSYGASQLDHALAMRQPGSVFKPFVYAAALDTGIQGNQQIFTPASLIDDAPTTFQYGRRTYQPGNFGHEYMGEVDLRTALAHSLNNASVALADEVGYRQVVAVARRAGLNDEIQPTPSVALGAYETTPLEMAGAYTVFANGGVHVTPSGISLVRGRGGEELYRNRPEHWPALDPRVAYLMVNMMQEVLDTGTGAGVRSRGFTLPAAGKTGTAHDGWFAGFTSNLLCVVWVGFDDDRDLKLEGAHSALPIWTDFMKRATRLRPYRDVLDFEPPPGIVSIRICPEGGQLAGDRCPNARSEFFIDGTQPVIRCELHSLHAQPSGPAVVGSFPSGTRLPAGTGIQPAR